MSAYKCCYAAPRDFSALRSRIAEKYTYEYQFADTLGMNKQKFSKKMRSVVPFNPQEIRRICELLDISRDEIPQYFRTPLLPKDEQKGLRAVIKEKYGNAAALARHIGMQKNALCHRLNFQIDFRYSELSTIADALGLSMSELIELLEIERRKIHDTRSERTSC